MSKNQTTTELVAPEKASVAIAPATFIDMSADAGAGLQHVDPSTLSLPFLKVLQSGSPETKRANEKFINGAKEGDILNTLTGELFDGDQGIRVIICSIQKRELEWAPKAESLGRPVASYPFGSSEIPPFTVETVLVEGKPKKVRQTKSGNTLNETDELYVLRVDDAGFAQPAVIAMDSSDLGCSRRVTSQLYNRQIAQGNTSFKAPIYGQLYTLYSADKHKDDYDWKIWKAVQEDALVSDPGLYAQAKAFHEAVEPKQTQVIRSQPQIEAAPAAGGTPAAAGEDVPF